MDAYFKKSILEHKPVPSQIPTSAGSEPLTIAVAISWSDNSKNVVKWALKKFALEKNVVFKLIHIHPKITSLPTPSGSTFSISDIQENVAAMYRRQVMQETEDTLLKPFKKMFERKKFGAELLVIESNSVAEAITREVNKHLISKLVVGRSSHNAFSRNYDITAKISANVSNFCTVYVVPKGVYALLKEKLSSNTERNETSIGCASDKSDSTSHSSGSGPSSDAMSDGVKANPHTLSMKRLQHLPTILRGVSVNMETSSVDSDETRMMSLEVSDEASKRNSPKTSRTGSWNPRSRGFDERTYAMSSVSSNREYDNDYITDDQDTFKEITKLRAELRLAQKLYEAAHVETLDASRKLNELNNGDQTLKEEAIHETKEKENVEEKLQYQEFSWEEIISATSSFSEDLKIGMGANGTVYKCNLHHTVAAVKVLHSAESSRSKQFDQEIDILSKIRHPHLVLLLGACPERGALVYEYMKNGSLEDRLFQVNNSQPIPWFFRFKIAWEVASALVFLHKSKPKPIIHRDLKPANILLDHNFVSKVGDVGLSTMIQVDPLSTKLTMYKQTSPVGTLCYIDPEYQRTGMISPKSDVYAFGMIILQLLTAQPAIALTHKVETAMESDNHEYLIQILDRKAGNWPTEETRKLAALALSCTEIRAKDRPDLEDHVLPALESLKRVADKARNLLSTMPSRPPSYFLCPLLKDVMREPCVASDGYTYDRKAIEEWMESHHTSPVTNSPLQNISLLPDHTLEAAIAEWRRRNQ